MIYILVVICVVVEALGSVYSGRRDHEEDHEEDHKTEDSELSESDNEN